LSENDEKRVLALKLEKQEIKNTQIRSTEKRKKKKTSSYYVDIMEFKRKGYTNCSSKKQDFMFFNLFLPQPSRSAT